MFTRDEVKTHRQLKAHPPCLVAQLDHHPVGGGRYPHIHGQHKAHPPHPKVDSCEDVACVSVKDAIILKASYQFNHKRIFWDFFVGVANTLQ